jgi:hypothetical protein
VPGVGPDFTPRRQPAPTPAEPVGYFAALIASDNAYVLANGIGGMSAQVEGQVVREQSLTAFGVQAEEQSLTAFAARPDVQAEEQSLTAFAARPDVQAFMRRHLPRPMNLRGTLLRRPLRREPRRALRAGVRRRRRLVRAGPGRARPRRADDVEPDAAYGLRQTFTNARYAASSRSSLSSQLSHTATSRATSTSDSLTPQLGHSPSTTSRRSTRSTTTKARTRSGR